MNPWWIKSRKWVITLFIFFGVLLLMDSCMQFRMSKSEIDKYFENKQTKGTFHSYEISKRVITYVKAGEVVQAGQPLYRIANLDTLTLRAYVAEKQLGSITLGQRVQVHVDQGDGSLRSVTGTVRWVSSKAEFTPTPIQTRDERSDLVYAVKVDVPNPRGALKIGMPADIQIAASPRGS